MCSRAIIEPLLSRMRPTATGTSAPLKNVISCALSSSKTWNTALWQVRYRVGPAVEHVDVQDDEIGFRPEGRLSGSCALIGQGGHTINAKTDQQGSRCI